MIEYPISAEIGNAKNEYNLSATFIPVELRTATYNGEPIVINANTDEQINENIQEYIDKIEIEKDTNDIESNGFSGDGIYTYSNGLPEELTLTSNNIIQRYIYK